MTGLLENIDSGRNTGRSPSFHVTWVVAVSMQDRIDNLAVTDTWSRSARRGMKRHGVPLLCFPWQRDRGNRFDCLPCVSGKLHTSRQQGRGPFTER